MTKYYLQEGLDTGSVDVVQSIDLSGSPDLNVVNLINQMSEHKRDIPWGIKTGGSIASRMLIHDGILYFGCNDHNFYALDARTGRELWRFRTRAQASVLARASVWRDRILFSSYDRNVYCLSLDGKKVHWTFAAQDKICCTPVVHEDVVYFGSRDRNLYALDAETGKQVWRLSVEHELASDPMVYKDSIYFASRGGVYRASMNGRVEWRFPLNGDANENMAILDDVIYFGCTDRNVYALSTAGNLVWKYPAQDIVLSDITIEDGRIYAGSFDGNVYCLSMKGNLIWKFQMEDVICAAPKIYGDRIFFSDCERLLYCTNKEGKLLWKKPMDGFVLYVLIRDGIVYAGGWDCKMHAFTIDGEKLWEFNTSMSNQSELEFEMPVESSFEVVWKPQFVEEKTKKEKQEALGNYGDFRGGYIQEDMRDYMGSSMGKGPGMAYKSGSKVYKK